MVLFMNKWVEMILCILVFCICIVLVIIGQKTVGIKNLLLQLVGLVGILALLYGYNKKYK
ncbi:hypothetical protein HMPREF0240_00936 [Clostridium sp. D5]|nr:hypothetical protein HMPREF0240_00936 [Clostridium sp. D5]